MRCGHARRKKRGDQEPRGDSLPNELRRLYAIFIDSRASATDILPLIREYSSGERSILETNSSLVRYG